MVETTVKTSELKKHDYALRSNLAEYLIEKEVVENRPKTSDIKKELDEMKKRDNDAVSYTDEGTHYVVRYKVKLARMFVKPFTKEGIAALEDLLNNPYACKNVDIERMEGGSYCITAKWAIYSQQDFMENFWGILFRRFMSEASVLANVVEPGGYIKKNICWKENDVGMIANEEDSDKYFYIVSISPVLIESASLPRFYHSRCA